MRILFLCGSLEPGKDGVGDYTRRLACELIRQAHSCSIIAIMDKGVNVKNEEMQEIDNTSISVVRLPFNNGYKLNCIEAKPWVDNFNPDWISLQYVPFSFHPKGLPFGFAKSIKLISKQRMLHIMFHELWVGMNKESVPKFKVLGAIQKKMIQSFIKNTKPYLLHTQTQLYRWQLKKIEENVLLLPLFSNNRVNTPITVKEKKESIHFVVFGNIHHGAPIEDFCCCLEQFIKNKSIDIEISFIGLCGPEQQCWISICESKKIKIKVFGEQSSQTISEVLNSASIGITTTPLILTEKSGTVAAMKEHGLSILCVSNSWEVKGFSNEFLPIDVQLFKKDQFDSYLCSSFKTKNSQTLLSVANQFLDSLLKFK
jgi:hypothetical protein